MRPLVTDSVGFIGSAVIRHIIDNTNHSVVNVDKLTYAGNLESLSFIENNSRYAFGQVDICDAKEIKRVFNEHQPGIVMHLSAESQLDRKLYSFNVEIMGMVKINLHNCNISKIRMMKRGKLI